MATWGANTQLTRVLEQHGYIAPAKRGDFAPMREALAGDACPVLEED